MSVIDTIISELKNTQYPLYLFGKGTSTNRIIDYLRQQEVPMYGVLVNRDYMPKGNMRIKDLPVVCFEDFTAKNDCEVLICTGDWEESSFTEENRIHIHKIHAYDFWGLFAIEEWNLWDDVFLKQYEQELNIIRESLCDEKSKQVFDENLKQRTMLTYARVFDHPQMQYFDEEIINLSEEVFVDCGAYHGENLVELQKLCRKDGKARIKKAYEIEADPKNIPDLRENISNINNICIIDKGVWNKSGFLLLDDKESKSSKVVESGGVQIPVITIDDMVGDDAVTFIKMDVEGAEFPALEGAINTIKRNKPKLAISIYHRPEDLIKISAWIRALDMDYKFYLRCYSRTGCETILYAV